MDVSGIGPIGGGQPVRRVEQPIEPPASPEARPVSPTDELELSAVDSAAAEVQLQTQFRAHRLEQIRQQIESGSYETPEKLDAAVNRMLEELLAE